MAIKLDILTEHWDIVHGHCSVNKTGHFLPKHDPFLTLITLIFTVDNGYCSEILGKYTCTLQFPSGGTGSSTLPPLKELLGKTKQKCLSAVGTAYNPIPQMNVCNVQPPL